MTSDVVMVKYWGGGLRCFLNLSPKVHEDSPMHSPSHSTLSHLYLYSTSPLDRILIFGSHKEVFDSGSSFKVHLHPMITAHLLEAFIEPSVIWNKYVWFLDVISSSVLFVVTAFLLSLTS